MITKSELEKLLASTETYRVERTKSTTDKDKFGEAVCAFANDMPDCGKPGYLFIGVDNEGHPCGMKATDELEANGNGKAEFSFRLITAFEAKVAKAGHHQELDLSKQDSSMKSSMKSEDRLLFVLKDDQTMSLPKMAEAIGLSVAGVRKVLDRLRASGRIRRIGPDKGGHWEVIDVEAK